jgi:putative acetyltransferase
MAEVIRPYTPADAAVTRAVFVRAVRQGAAGRYSPDELLDWLPDPAMPEDWGDWLAEHITLVAEDETGITGFFLLERDGYLNMAFVLPERMGKGTADALYAGILRQARALGLTQLTVLASRYAQGFLLRHGWRMAPDLPPREGLDLRQEPGDTPLNRPMALELEP